MSINPIRLAFFNIFFRSHVGDLFGSMLTSLEPDILPFPHVKGIDLGPTMRRKVREPLHSKNRGISVLSIRILLKKTSFVMPTNSSSL